MSASWPPCLMFNSDGNWVNNYQERHDPSDLTRMIGPLRDAGVDLLSVLIGIDDDLSWRGSPHGQLWCDNVTEWDVDGVPTDIHGNPISDGAVHIHGRATANRKATNAHEELFNTIASVIEDGHDLMQIYVDGAHEHGLPVFASMRMNDAHTDIEDRMWYGRSTLKIERPDLPDRFGHAGGQARRRVDLQLDVGLRAGRGAAAVPGHRGRDADPLRLRRAGVRLLPATAVLPRRRGRAEHPRHDRLRATGARRRPPTGGAARARPALRRSRPDQHRRVAVHRHRHAGVDPRGAGRRVRDLLARLLRDQGGRGRGGRGGWRRGAGLPRLRRQHLRGSRRRRATSATLRRCCAARV